MKQYKVVMTPKAFARIQQLYDYILYRFCSPVTAERQINRIRKTIDKLAVFPLRHPVVMLSKKKQEIRRIYVDYFSVFYMVREEEEKVIVINILHSSSNLMTKLAEDMDDENE